MRRSERLKKKRTASEAATPVSEANVDDPVDGGILHCLPVAKIIKPFKKRKHEVIDWRKWIAATSTKNYLMDDAFLDVLSSKSSTVIKANPNYSKEIGKMVKLTTNTTGFVPSLLQSGNVFENKIVGLLTQEFGKQNVKDIGGNHNARSTQKYEETISALNAGVPCIFQAVLRNYENKTYGIPDILIRSDWINKFLDVNALSEKEMYISAPELKNPMKNSRRFRKSRNKNVRYHYIVVDIKYKTLPLRSDGIHLRNDSNLKAYKSQLWIYTEALAKIQGYCPPYAFILGSKWKYTSSNTTFEGKSCFERLGRIDYKNLDKDYILKTEKAVKWINEVRTKGDSWDLSKYPLPRDELYPNMCNRYDYPYHGIKKTFAEANDDLTMLWNVGPKQRRIANANGVYNWKDPNCTPENLGVTGKIKSKILGRILEANHSEGRKIYPKYINHNFSDWQNVEERQIELFVDFETTCSVFSDLEELPVNNSNGLIFLIGAGYIHPKTNKWIFKEFVVDEINEVEELKICKDFVKFVKDLEKKFKVDYEIPCYHWAPHEPTTWRKVFERNKIPEMELDWTDMLKIFLLEPIGIKDVLNYGLKNVAKSFYKHGYISTTWDSEGNCADGADAAISSFRANKECIQNQTSFAEHPLTLEIVKYNEVDCKVLAEIMYYLREHHIDPEPVEEIEDFSSDLEEEYKTIFSNKKRKIE